MGRQACVRACINQFLSVGRFYQTHQRFSGNGSGGFSWEGAFRGTDAQIPWRARSCLYDEQPVSPSYFAIEKKIRLLATMPTLCNACIGVLPTLCSPPTHSTCRSVLVSPYISEDQGYQPVRTSYSTTVHTRHIYICDEGHQER